MTYEVQLTSRVERELRKLDKQVAARITTTLRVLAVNPRPPAAKMLQGDHAGLWRVRIGDYRAIYSINDGALTVLVLRIAHRSRVYD